MSKPDFILNGMELRDYLAAHAPAAPDWFRNPEGQKIPHDVYEDPERKKAWIREQQATKFFEWRWFYADAMMASRTDSKQKPE